LEEYLLKLVLMEELKFSCWIQ